MTEATNNASGLIRMVRSHGSVCWEELDGESFEFCQQDSDYECREFYTAPPADNQGTTGDKYRAELYDEVWQKARDMGYGNVTEALAALVALERLRGAPPAAAVVMPAYRHLSEGLDATFVEGYNAALDEVARLNPAPDHVEQPLGMVPADHVEHVRAMVVPKGWRRAVYYAEECLTGCLASPGIARSLDVQTVRNIIAMLRDARLAMLAAPTPEPASPISAQREGGEV